MRRFIQSLPGRTLSQLLAFALALPFLSLAFARTANAQFQSQPRWAVVPFINLSKKGADTLGQAAADAVYSEFAKTGKYDLEAPEAVQRTIETLGLAKPVTEKTSLLRLAQELRVATLVTGEVADWQIRSSGGGKQADVAVKVIVLDVASGLPINGALINEHSSVRAQDPSDEVLINEALMAAASRAVAAIQAQTLPTATVLNTRPDGALINQGSRTGFKIGQEVVVVRGREQVSTAKVIDVEEDSSIVRVTRQIKGIQPGDKVRVVVDPGNFVAKGFGGNGKVTEVGIQKPRRSNNSSAIITLALVLGLVFILLSQGRSGNNSAVGSFTAEAGMFPTNSGSPAVKLTWSRDLFQRGLDNTIQWQIWRDDILTSPVVVADRTASFAYDTTAARDLTYSTGNLGGLECAGLGEDTADAVAGVIPGRPYQYQISLIYRVNEIDVIGSSTGGGTTGTGGTGLNTGGGTTTGGTTAGTTGTTGGTTTGGTTGGGTTTGGAGGFCYFTSDKTTASGFATPLTRVNLQSPANNATVTSYLPFSFSSAVNPAFPSQMGYVVQLSSEANFARGATFTSNEVIRTDVTSISITLSPRYPGDTFLQFLTDNFPGKTQFWWRVGARNVADNPGPVADASGFRYVFSSPQRFVRPAPPPGK
ncbi:MAG TPA: hypothetical protein PKA27_05265 [Fimbriimonadaceae bacterium]|nr:hypothetical protein [Fimbriimonadaceae bacterium]